MKRKLSQKELILHNELKNVKMMLAEYEYICKINQANLTNEALEDWFKKVLEGRIRFCKNMINLIGDRIKLIEQLYEEERE